VRSFQANPILIRHCLWYKEILRLLNTSVWDSA
jgi:hypothetical protein